MWTPPSLILLDTETSTISEGDREILTLRLWVALRHDRRNVRKTDTQSKWGRGTSPNTLADWVCEQMERRDCVWLYAHNLNFDLVTTRLPLLLVERGWTIKDFAVSASSPWFRLGKGGKSLTILDSFSWLPQRLESIATLQNMRKEPLPGEDDDPGTWWRRCAGDVRILARAVLSLMEWWDAEKLGNWTITGAGCGWNAMRHIYTADRVVVDVTPELVAGDRDAVRGGRKDAERMGALGTGPFVELDLVAAYPSVPLHLPTPRARGWAFTSLPLDSPYVRSNRWSIIAECEIETSLPRYPCRHGGVTWFPVGRFKTTLAAPEIRWAADNGDLVAIGPGQVHQLGYPLQPWAKWVLETQESKGREVPQVARAVAKTWGRSVIGKFGAHSHSTESLGPALCDGWSITEGRDHAKGKPAALVEMAGEAWWVVNDLDSDNCYPALLAWIESEVRVRLSRVLEQLSGSWVSCDTDGLIMDMTRPDLWARFGVKSMKGRLRDVIGVAEALCADLAPLTAPLVLRPKRIIEDLDVLGPQHLTIDGERKMSGVASNAKADGAGGLVVRDWPKLASQIRMADPRGYVRPERTLHFDGPLVHRWVTTAGTCLPAEVSIDADGRNQLVPWESTRHAAAGAELADDQYLGLAGLH